MVADLVEQRKLEPKSLQATFHIKTINSCRIPELWGALLLFSLFLWWNIVSQGKSVLFCLFFKGSGGDGSMGHNTEEEAKLLPSTQNPFWSFIWIFSSFKTARRWIFKVLLGKFYQLTSGLQREGLSLQGKRSWPFSHWSARGKGLAGDPGSKQFHSPRVCICLGSDDGSPILWLGVFEFQGQT